MPQPGDRAPAPPPLDLVQDLINTVDIEMDDDRLTTVVQLREFCATHGVPVRRLTREDVEEARALREELRAVGRAHAGENLTPLAMSQLSQRLAAAPVVVVVDEGGRIDIRPSAGLGGARALAAHVASAAIAAMAAGTWRRLKACGAADCRWAYYDRSPGGRSRWCTMSICGSREKMRRYRQRT